MLMTRSLAIAPVRFGSDFSRPAFDLVRALALSSPDRWAVSARSGRAAQLIRSAIAVAPGVSPTSWAQRTQSRVDLK